MLLVLCDVNFDTTHNAIDNIIEEEILEFSIIHCESRFNDYIQSVYF